MDNIRTILYERCASLSSIQIEAKSKQICAKVKEYLPKQGVLGFYMAMPKEVQVQELLQECMETYTCAVPITYGKGQMEFRIVTRDTQFQPGAYGILEPMDAPILKQDMDAILVPLVGFDGNCHRMGHGAGYYDCFLADKDCLKIGVAFACQKCERIRTYPHDVDMDIIISEDAIYQKAE